MTNITTNRRARFDYELEKSYEAGIELTGSEVKTLRTRGASVQEAYVAVEDNQIWLINANIDPYEPARNNHEPRRRRRLLLHRAEIEQLAERTQSKGYTIVPVRLYWNHQGRAKLEIALAKGKHTYDKRKAIRERDELREAQRDIRNA